jgi:hypothetical protein
VPESPPVTHLAHSFSAVGLCLLVMGWQSRSGIALGLWPTPKTSSSVPPALSALPPGSWGFPLHGLAALPSLSGWENERCTASVTVA